MFHLSRMKETADAYHRDGGQRLTLDFGSHGAPPLFHTQQPSPPPSAGIRLPFGGNPGRATLTLEGALRPLSSARGGPGGMGVRGACAGRVERGGRGNRIIMGSPNSRTSGVQNFGPAKARAGRGRGGPRPRSPELAR